MKYIIFNEPPESLPSGCDMIGNNASGDAVFRLSAGAEMPSGYHEATVAETVADAETMSAFIRSIESAADTFHKRFLGAETARREARFKINQEMAAEVAAGTATDETKAALQLQADAQARKSGDPAATMPLADFVAWILAWTPPSRLISSAIEAFIVDARTAALALPNSIDTLVRGQFTRDLKAQAEAKFAELTANND